jgi:hypothetical protein
MSETAKEPRGPLRANPEDKAPKRGSPGGDRGLQGLAEVKDIMVEALQGQKMDFKLLVG